MLQLSDIFLECRQPTGLQAWCLQKLVLCRAAHMPAGKVQCYTHSSCSPAQTVTAWLIKMFWRATQ
jgi:hypothetical protein